MRSWSWRFYCFCCYFLLVCRPLDGKGGKRTRHEVGVRLCRRTQATRTTQANTGKACSCRWLMPRCASTATAAVVAVYKTSNVLFASVLRFKLFFNIWCLAERKGTMFNFILNRTLRPSARDSVDDWTAGQSLSLSLARHSSSSCAAVLRLS